MTFMAKPKIAHPELPKNALGLTRRDYEGANSTLCAGCGHDSITAAIVEACWANSLRAAERGQAVRHRLLLQDHRLLRQRRARIQFGARPHALDRDRRQRRQPRADLHRRVRRRRYAVDRARPVLPRDPPQSQHGLCDREQRRLRSHQGPVLGLGRCRQHRQEGRSQQAAADRSGAAGDHARACRSSRAASPATRRSWCRCCRRRCITRASR